MSKILCLTGLCILLAANGFTQSNSGSCGTGLEENLLIKQRMMNNRIEWNGKLLPRTGATTFIPINFWLMAKDNGTGRLPLSKVLDFMCCINESSVYKDMDLQFYINKIQFENRTYVYDDPSSQLGEAYLRSYMLSNKNAVNIFIANVARASDLGVLAFYTSNGDYIVAGKANVSGDCTTLAHELGHYFSLPHTFVGWEGLDYYDITANCTKATPTVVGNGILVEYVDRNKAGTGGKKHCEQSADGFCDTPADYNLGYGWPANRGCNYDSCAKDPLDVLLGPMEDNLMSYFLNCIKTFTAEQRAAILKDYLSSARNYLRRTPAYSALPAIADQVNYISPTSTNTPVGYDEVKFDWEDVPNATHYWFELAENTGFTLNAQFYLLTKSDTTLKNLVKNKTYHWRVFPFNSNSTCLVPKLISFKNPAWTVSAENIVDANTKTYIVQQESLGCHWVIETQRSQEFKFQIFNLSGQRIRQGELAVQEGKHSISLSDLNAGAYFYSLSNSANQIHTGKFIIH